MREIKQEEVAEGVTEALKLWKKKTEMKNARLNMWQSPQRNVSYCMNVQDFNVSLSLFGFFVQSFSKITFFEWEKNTEAHNSDRK